MAKNNINLRGNSSNYLTRNETTNAYFRDINKQGVILTVEEERELFEKMAAGDKSARETIISAHLKLVVSVAKFYADDEKVNELIQWGNIGLLKAVDSVFDEDPKKRYDWKRGVKFDSFAIWYIRREIQRWLVNDAPIVRKTNTTKTTYHLSKIKNAFFAENGRYPTEEELVELLEKKNIKIGDISDIYDVTVSSINTTYNDDDDNAFENSICFTSHTSGINDFETDAEKEHNTALSGMLLSTLDEREQNVVRYAFGIGHLKEYTNAEIADELGISTERVRQIKAAALKKMRSAAVEAGAEI